MEKINEQYGKWIININYDSKIHYMVWYTDVKDDDKDKFIINESKKIIASESIILLQEFLLKEEKIADKNNTNKWIHECLKLDQAVSILYDLDIVFVSLKNKLFTHKSLESFVNFVNIFTDYAEQIYYKELLGITSDDDIRDLWEYYYDNILIKKMPKPHIADKVSSRYKGDFEVLSGAFSIMVEEFFGMIEIVK